MKLHDFINLVLMACISAGVSWVVATRFAPAGTQVVVIDVAAAVKGIDSADPAFRTKLQDVMEKAREAADRYSEAGYIVLDGRGVARVPRELLINPVAETESQQEASHE